MSTCMPPDADPTILRPWCACFSLPLPCSSHLTSPLQLVRSLTVCRVLVVPRPAYAALAADFPMSATAILNALQRNAERVRVEGGLG